ncbi:MAG: alpha/beta hydrolase [Lachnospiraceae bacterium]|nr:alpha/beta hydrolase [Lachnospiraceae bacterium]
MKKKPMKRSRKIILWISGILIGLFLAAVIVVQFFPDIAVRFMAPFMGGTGNTDAGELELETETLAGGVRVVRNAAYDEDLPNGYLDIYLPPEQEDPAPVVLLIHGGGYCGGDKENNYDYICALAEAGYAVAAPNYVLAPAYRYPEPVRQLMEAVRFIPEYTDKYGFDDENIVFGGDSAGGQLAGQLALIITDPEYAGKMDIEPAIEPEQLKGVIFNCALIDIARIDDTDDDLENIAFRDMGEAYFNDKDFETLEDAEEANILLHVSSAFPASYITDGSRATFTDQALDLAEKLEGLGVMVVNNVYEDQGLRHEYQRDITSKYGKENLEKTIEFIRTVTR